MADASGNSAPSAVAISVIIPCLSEAGYIRRTLESVERQPGPHETIIVDGGSVDATRAIAAFYGRVIRTERGRGRQMNAGAAEANHDVLFFLHADTVLSPHAFDRIRAGLDDPTVEAGAFRLRFDRPSPLLRIYSFCTRFRWPRLCFGDRGLFIRRHVFEEIGGFPSIPLFEDLELVRALNKRGGFVFLEESVMTSARRFEKTGPLVQQLLNAYLWGSYLIGTDPHHLVRHYPYRDGD